MKNYGVVSGHCFSRSALENMKADLDKAIEEMNRPEVTHLARVRHRDTARMGVVLIGGNLQRTYATAIFGSGPAGAYTVADERGEGYTFHTESGLLSIWEVVK